MNVVHTLVAAATAFSLVSGCGGGDDLEYPEQAAQAPITLKGTDANRNGVRDEVEAAIADAAGSDAVLKRHMLALARQYQTWYDHPNADMPQARALLLESARLGRCLEQARPKVGAAAAAEVRLRTFNLKPRAQAMLAIYRKAGVFVVPDLEGPCT